MQAADEADVRLDVEIDFDVEEAADLGVPERVDPFHQNRAARTDQLGVRGAAALGENHRPGSRPPRRPSVA